ncbi:Aste57867_12518 [Aphanomyces stellatus]|uniref:Aste57867_12518 protein n=1 Tax=Aphanomyces stellatus TaxID=120398 RepID=A0A485KVU6_9STRA|nr:hypothetical protein As57867_012472 [Aphanomyces stellatus]VFT89369.1 Aste57867_12518 [Aphanomyces stellatus]
MSRAERPTAAPSTTFETTLPWEERQGATPLDRTVKVGKERQMFFERHKETPSAIQVDHIQQVGHAALHLATRVEVHKAKSKKKLVRDVDSDSNSDDEFESKMHQDELDQFLMGEEWDTRFWNRIKIHEAISTLYAEIEKSTDVARRQFAFKMLLHLNTIHREAYMTNENNLCTLSNRAFRKLSPTTDNDAIYNMAELLAVFAAPYAHALAHENAVLRALAFLLRQMDCAARVLQHFRRRRVFERQVRTQDISLEGRMRMRAINVAKCVELSRQQHHIHAALRGAHMPERAVVAYMRIMCGLIQDELHPQHGFPRHDRSKIIPAGGLVWLNRCVQSEGEIQCLATQLLTVLAHDKERISDILLSNVAIHVASLLTHGNASAKALALAFFDRAALSVCEMTYEQHSMSSGASDVATGGGKSSYRSMVRTLSVRTRSSGFGSAASDAGTSSSDDILDAMYRNRHLSHTVLERFMTPPIVTAMLQTLDSATTPTTLVLDALQVVHKVAHDTGYYLVIDLVTRNAGRHLEAIVRCLSALSMDIVLGGMHVLMALAARDEGREVLTIAGLVPLVTPLCAPGYRKPGNSVRFAVGLLVIVVCANPTNTSLAFAPPPRPGMYAPMKLDVSPAHLLDHVHTCLLHCVVDDPNNGQGGTYFLRTQSLEFVLELLLHAPGETLQTRAQRHISAIVLSGLCRVTKIASLLSRRQDVATHLALVIQTNRMEASERVVWSRLDGQRHLQSSAHVARAFVRFLRCQKQTHQPPAVYLATQLHILRTLVKLHALEDVVAFCRPVDAVCDFVADDMDAVKCAIQLIGLVCPVPLPEHWHHVTTTVDGIDLATLQSLIARLVNAAMVALLNTLAADDPLPRVVKWCCCTLAQLCCTNASCTQVLEFRCMDVIAALVPNVPSDARASMSTHVVHVSACAEDDKLIDIPPTLYTLLAQFCRVADGRAAIFRLNILPRILKRVHLASSSKGLTQHDHQCRAEIALLVASIANDNVVALGNVNELCLRHHVHTILVQMLDPPTHDATAVPPGLVPSLQENALAAMAAMAKDHTRCVPPFVAAGALPLVVSFVTRWDRAAAISMAMLESAVHVMCAIAQSPVDAIQAAVRATSVTEELLRVGCSFRLEMIKFAAFGTKSIGEVARETLRHLSDFEAAQHRPPSNKTSPWTHGALPPRGNHSPTASRHHDAPASPPRDDEAMSSAVVLTLPTLAQEPSTSKTSPPKSPAASTPTLPSIDWRTTRPKGPKPIAEPPTVTFIRPKPVDERKKYPLLMLDPLFGALEHGVDPCMNQPSRLSLGGTSYVAHVTSTLGQYVQVDTRSPETKEVSLVHRHVPPLSGSMSVGKIQTKKHRTALPKES